MGIGIALGRHQGQLVPRRRTGLPLGSQGQALAVGLQVIGQGLELLPAVPDRGPGGRRALQAVGREKPGQGLAAVARMTRA